MFFYKLDDKVLFSNFNYDLDEISETEAMNSENTIYFLNRLNPLNSRRIFSIAHPSLIYLEKENINLINICDDFEFNTPLWIMDKINDRKVMGINTNYPNWKEFTNYTLPESWKVNIVGLGDVGSTLLIGLKLLGGNTIDSIGLYGLNKDNLKRLEYEMNQIIDPFSDESMPTISIVKEDELFNCDMFVFCASKGIPPVGSKVSDVRMIQFEENAKIVSHYAKKARNSNFKGIFSVVSDPVDPLCKVSFISSNKDKNGNLDFLGLSSDQIRGYGLGVMNARAIYYSKKDSNTENYISEGRAFGPHGKGLIIANSINNYNEELSLNLTNKAINANIDVRNTGFKPYIAPALSSGALSLINTMKGNWNYSSTYMGDVFMGAKNRLTQSGVEIEMLHLPEQLLNRIRNTYKDLNDIDCSKF
ncbi:lactate/malate family dehydrogenase [Tepidibacter hydrothermalis]|uniref:Lactate dehydrogenase n=1 Tax=Tepidibacter hydrothermalis TaxID=3036126 RepID=A0ABY8EEF7_9FIRM|nr:lactate dehydrogenase [Tepidibacter hydrothermalis]WFD11333.1 lactate dehydrogenase [Tepidibacter hydrothermalis]